MYRVVALLSSVLLLGVAACVAEDLPDPYVHAENPHIGPVPVPVMEQVFWVQLEIAPEVDLKVETPEGVAYLDRTKPGTEREFSRFYFRAAQGMKDAVIAFSSADGAAITVPLTVKTYREDIEEQIRRVPGMDFSARKAGRSYYTDGMIATARENIEKYPELAEDIKGRNRYQGMSDDELWEALPSWNVPRDCYSAWPCPKCGAEIFKKDAFYPWSPGIDFKCTCPICGQKFPTNDYLHDDFTSGDYPDDGWGYDPGSGDRNKMAGWIANCNHQAIWSGSGVYIRKLAYRYLLFGDEEAAHSAGVLLARMAYLYPGLNMRWQQVVPQYLRPGRALLDGDWERTGVIVPALQAYDAIWDYMGQDGKLVEFLRTKDPTIETPEDARKLIDTYFVQLAGVDWMNRELSGGSQGAREKDLAEFIVCANMGPVCDRWLEELFTHAFNSGIDKGGFDDETQINTLNREGPTLVSAFDYSIIYLRSKSGMAELLGRVDDPKWKSRCDLYNAELYPKLNAEFDTWLNMIAAGQFPPSYGDSPFGTNRGGQTVRLPEGPVNAVRSAYERAYRRFRTDSLAHALYKAGKKPPELFEPDVWEDVEAQVAQAGPPEPLRSRVIDGTGFVFMESRPDAEDINSRAAIALRYGYGAGHNHQDTLNIEMWAHGESVAPELGYPCWTNAMGNTSFVAHHNTGMIDRVGQYNGPTAHGTLEMFGAGADVAFADVSGEPTGFPNRVYRRAVCLTDAPGGNVYLLDVLRMAGGTRRTYCFHGFGQKAFESNLQFGPKSVDPFPVGTVGRGLENNLLAPQEARSDGAVWADWTHDKSALHMRLDVLAEAGREYFTARCGKPDIPAIQYLFAEDEAEDGASEFVAFWQPYADAPFIESVERLDVEGAEDSEFQPVAVRVTLTGGQVDTFIYTSDPDTELVFGDFEFMGSFGYWSELNGEFRRMQVVNGSFFCKNGVGLQNALPSFTAEVIAAEPAKNTLTLDKAIPDGGIIEGQLLYLSNGPHRTAYHVESLSDDRKTVRVRHNPIIYRSKIMSFADDGSHLVAEMTPRLPAAGGAEPYGYYDGAFVTGEDGRAQYRVKSVNGDSISLDRAIDASDFPDVDGDGRQMIFIYDFGPGEQATVYNSVYAAADGSASCIIGSVEQ